jgi:hypothetical protein
MIYNYFDHMENRLENTSNDRQLPATVIVQLKTFI